MKKKKIIIIMSTLIVVVLLITGIIAIIKNKKQPAPSTPTNTVQESQIKNVKDFVGELEDGTKVNTNAKLKTPSTLGDYSIDNIRLTMKNGISTFRATATNNSNAQTELKEVTLVLLNENGEEMVTAHGILNQAAPGASQELNISVTSDYIHAAGYKLSEK